VDSILLKVLLCLQKKKISAIHGISEEGAIKIIAAAHQIIPIMKFTNALDFYYVRKDITYISLGSKALDKMLDGGIESGYITEIFGEFGTGKTQLCHQLCVTCQLEYEKGGGQGKALVIDTEGCFRPERCAEIAEKYQLNPDDVLSNISYARAYNTEQQLSILNDAAKMMAENPYAVIIVDSATALYRTDYTGRAELSERQNHLAQFMRKLGNLAAEFGVAAFVTNQVVSNPQSQFNEKMPIGGNIMGHASTTRLQLKKSRDHNIMCRVYDSPHLAQLDALFTITKNGIEDVEDASKKAT